MFKSKKELNGALDPNINVAGRPIRTAKVTNRELREREFLTLLRKIKPLVADSINTASNIMRNEQASHQNQLKAATLLLQQYKDMVGELYDKDYDEEVSDNEIQQANTPILSLTVLKNGTEQ